MTPAELERHELASRESDGIVVSLFWCEVGDTLTLEVDDTRGNCESFRLDVPRDRALDAFHHPYAYLAMTEQRAGSEPFAA
jgi:hypothetical protein